ncbi:signal recognition particle-docking protein FtsY [candidate division KSB1 bacterium]|nr:signal recognition particle-docking protein FtsY [candidate division KSB1 bacterium]
MNSVFGKLKAGLSRTRSGVVDKMDDVVKAHNEVNEDLWDELEEILISGDIGVNVSMKLIEDVRAKIEDLGIRKTSNILNFMKSAVKRVVMNGETDRDIFDIPESVQLPYVIIVVGVNGTGKTTSIGKLAHQFRLQNKKVLLAAADTFRAAASEQLEIWAKRSNVDIITNMPGTDPASVAYDSLQAAISRQVDVLIIDTAGRLHTKANLMEELKKVDRVLKKLRPDVPHETLLVMDATTGQNGLSQARQFMQAVGVTGIVLTKLDGTAKGGVVLSIRDELDVPVRLIGVGEQMEDLQPFHPEEFVEAMFQ